jgi:hypothetical protein
VFLGAGNNGLVPTIEAMEAWYAQATHPGSNVVHFTVYDLEDLAPIGTALLVRVDHQAGTAEFAQVGEDEDVAKLAALFDEEVDLLSADDVQELAAGLQPNSSAAVLVFEHTWAAPLKQAVEDAGGRLVANFRVPGAVVDEVLAALREA